MLRLAQFFAFVLLFTPIRAQQQHRHWFFGFGAALDMAGATPSVINGSPMQTDEGVTSISSSTGELLFFTNGERVWDRDLQQMPEGHGLAGNFSSSQSALIVLDPGNDDRYYIFTTPGQLAVGGGIYDGLSYSIVDMTLNNGNGDVAVKNIELVRPVVEKLSATRHANGNDVWVVAHGWENNVYYAYKVTCTRVEGPVVSAVGRSMNNDPNNSYFAAIGCMQFSAQGDRLASVWTQYLPDGSHELRLDVLHFDNTTGIISDPIGDTMISTDPDDARYAYGVCFSPSGRFLYRSEYGLNGGIGYTKILQYDMQSPDPMNSEVEVGSSFQAYGSLQRAPDGTIYIARLNGAQYLSRITSPDLPGDQCGLVDQGVSIAPNISTWGLPNHWDTYPEPIDFDPIAFSDTTVCGGSSITLDASWPFAFDPAQYLWSTGETSPSIEATASGIYSVEVILPCTSYFDTVEVTLRTSDLDLGHDLSICEGDSVLLSVEYDHVIWNTGDTSAIIHAREEGVYSVEVSIDDCIFSDEITLATRNCECPFHLPNAFTPNGDGINDNWSPSYDCEPIHFELKVFDRWGRELHRTTDPVEVWSGSDVPIGVYNYRLEYSWDDGEKIQHQERVGHMTVVR